MGGEGADAVRGPAPRGAGRADARASRGRTASSRRGGSCSRCSMHHRRSTSTRRDRGARTRPTSSSRVTAAGTSPGSCRERREAGDGARSAERRSTVAVHPDRGLRVPLQLPHGCARGAGRRDRLALRSTLRLTERVRQPARPRGGHVQLRAVRHQPSDGPRSTSPGTNVLVTTWKTPSGWIVVRDALTMGPSDHEDAITPHTRPPADDDADHLLVRTVECLEGSVEVELVCEPVFDYGSEPAEWTLVDGGRHLADATGAGQTIRLQTDLALGIEGDRVRARHVLAAGRAGLLRALVGRGARGARRRGRGGGADRAARRASGARGWAGRASRTIAGATRSSARPSRSRD